MRILENTNYPFVASRKKAYVISGVLLAISLISFVVRGLEFGIDFQGGMEFVVEYEQEPSVAEVRSVLTDALGTTPEVKSYGENALLVRTLPEGDINAVQGQVTEAMERAFPESQPRLVKTDVVGPRFAEDLKRAAIYSVIGSLVVIFVYILLRFEWRFGLGAVIALFHDVICTLGMFSLLRGVLPFSLQIDQTIIAAFLTIIGYSINDTVVIFDRIREYANISKTEPLQTVIDRSINTTLGRTVITGGTTLLSLIVLFIFGGEVLRGFAFALTFGIILGTYSSIFVATPVVIELQGRAERSKANTAGRLATQG